MIHRVTADRHDPPSVAVEAVGVGADRERASGLDIRGHLRLGAKRRVRLDGNLLVRGRD